MLGVHRTQGSTQTPLKTATKKIFIRLSSKSSPISTMVDMIDVSVKFMPKVQVAVK